MLAEFEAIRAHLDGLEPALRTHLFYATPAFNDGGQPILSQVPYVVLETSSGAPAEEASVGADEYREFDVRVRYVTAVPDAPPKVRARVRGRLAQEREGARLVPMSGRRLFVECLGHEVGSQADRDITFSGTNTHPFYGVDTFRAYSHPA